MITSTNFGTENFAKSASEVLRSAKSVVLYVHDGLFHADDVLCAVLFEAHYKNIDRKVIRRRMTIDDIEELKSLDDGITRIVCDTGCQDLVTDNLLVLDHHSDNKLTYMNGVQYAAVGKFASCLRWAFPDSKIASSGLYNFQKTVLWPVEVQDNGQKAEDLNIQLYPNLFSWISVFNCSWNEDWTESSDRFFEAVELATKILDRQFTRLEGLVEAWEIVENEIESLNPSEILVLGKYVPWQEPVIGYNQLHCNQIKLIIFKSTGDQWNCQCVPVALGSFDTIIKAPEEWGGKTGVELEVLSGIEGAVFCHRGLWLTVWKTKDAALKAAELILDKNSTESE